MNVTPPDFDGRRVRAAGRPEIWLVYGSSRHHITAPEVYETLFDESEGIADVDLAAIPVGPDLGPGSGLIRADDGAIYLLARSTDGTALRHHLVDFDHLRAFRFRHDRIRTLPRDEIDAIPLGGRLGASRTERQRFEVHELGELARSLNPSRPTLLLLLDQPTPFAAAYAGQLQRMAARRVNALIGWTSGDRLLMTRSPDLTDAVAVTLPAVDPILEALRQLAIARIDVLATTLEWEVAPAALTAFGCPHDVTCLVESVPATGLSTTVQAADRLVACSRAVAERLQAMRPGREVHLGLTPEATRPEAFRVHPARIFDGDPLRVLVWGFLDSVARATVVRTARLARSGGHPIQFYRLGDESPADSADLIWLGPPEGINLNRMICALRPHLGWFPEPAREPYDFLISQAMLQGLPLLATTAGAYPERLSGRAFTWLLPESSSGEDWLAIMLRLHETRLALPSTSSAPEPPAFYPVEYLSWARSKNEPERVAS
ncbi:hypothetical protein [Methylobacterium nodulans]|uniref:Glycosyl transferase group 1 n=1 Tax=Methylobacterium nodulans (strain LMG 21967 / CNCM I-2342 / ORS 2060) TaxID=460265 RepID=B8IAD0_METNO|nr:hypothetical protein [Methylobacterium nodulans]ACL59193.1 hypothetical protein Mnod_4317 [Methylobacterium nodulans ORS 2060]